MDPPWLPRPPSSPAGHLIQHGPFSIRHGIGPACAHCGLCRDTPPLSIPLPCRVLIPARGLAERAQGLAGRGRVQHLPPSGQSISDGAHVDQQAVQVRVCRARYGFGSIRGVALPRSADGVTTGCAGCPSSTPARPSVRVTTASDRPVAALARHSVGD